MAFHQGFMGHAKIGGTLVKIASSSINPAQSIESPALVQGDWNPKAWNYGKIETGGGISGPIATNAASVWAAAWVRAPSGDAMANVVEVDIAYFSGHGRTFDSCQINSYELSVNAGDVAQFNIDFMGTTSVAYTGVVDHANDVACEKLITWDKCGFSYTGGTATQLQAFTFTVNNNLERIYMLNQSATFGLFPAAILAGIRNISGTLSFYADDTGIDAQFPVAPVVPTFGADHFDDYAATNTTAVSVFAGSVVTASGNVGFSRAQASAQTGTVIYTVSFTGLCNQTETAS